MENISKHDNSADDAFRGLDSTKLSKIQRWFNGPAFPLVFRKKLGCVISSQSNW